MAEEVQAIIKIDEYFPFGTPNDPIKRFIEYDAENDKAIYVVEWAGSQYRRPLVDVVARHGVDILMPRDRRDREQPSDTPPWENL